MSVRKFAIVLFTVMAVVGTGEAMSWAMFHWYLTDRLAVHWRIDAAADIAVLDSKQIDRYRTQFFDPVLGWTLKPDTDVFSYAGFDSAGARRDSLADSVLKIFAYGDSFTFGEDVANDQTWPHHFGRRMGTRVQNFGVPGYGPDQAVLRFKRHLEAEQIPDIAVLGVLSENIARVVNVYRHYYVTTSEHMAFKPVILADGEWRQTPLQSLTGKPAIIAAAKQAAAYDYWAEFNRSRPQPGFPYLWATFDTMHYLAFRVVRWSGLWRQGEPVERLNLVIGEFISLARKNDVKAVVLFIPMPDDLRARQGDQPPSYAAYLKRLRSEVVAKDVVIVDPLDAPFDAARFNLRPFQGHASDYGNKILADAVADILHRSDN